MRDPRIDEIPMVLETVEPAIWAEEIAWLRGQIRQLEPGKERPGHRQYLSPRGKAATLNHEATFSSGA